MNRRNFLSGLGALVGGLALEQAVPLGRVWSFPTDLVGAVRRKIDEGPSIGIRMIRAYDPLTDMMPMRLDVAFGYWKIKAVSIEEMRQMYPPSGRVLQTDVTIGHHGLIFPENSPEISE